MAEEVIRVDGIRKSFEAAAGETLALDGVSLTLYEGEFLSLVGPSGCGKTTLLRAVSGLAGMEAGSVSYRGVPVSGVPPMLQVVFQEYNRSLYPWLTVERNVRFALGHLSRDEADERAAEALRLVELHDFAGHYPWQLSGGMQQRVATARAIAARPELLLMDEPFASVDAQTRVTLEMMLLELWEHLRLAVLFVTHDIEEAILLSDRVLVLSPRPASVIAELEIDLPRPRDQLKTKELPRFLALREEIYSLVGLRSGPRRDVTVGAG